MTQSASPLAPQTSRPIHAMPVASQPAGRRFRATLPMNQLLAVGDHIVSDNGLFFALLQADGNFGVYRGIDAAREHAMLWSTRGRTAAAGSSATFFALLQTDGNFCIYRGSDLAHNEGWHWGSQITADGGQFYAAMQDDGNFSVRKGTGPDDSHGLVWASGVTDRVQQIEEVLHIEYELAAARVLRTSPATLYSETVNNRSGQIETGSMSGAVTVTETSSWADTLAVRPGPGIPFSGPVPVMRDEQVVLSDGRVDYLSNGVATSTKNWAFETPIEVAPQRSVRGVILVVYSTIAVPYVLMGRLRFESGAQVIGTICGAYLGSNAHNMSVSMHPLDRRPDQIPPKSRPITPTSLLN